ncbi:Retrovirus-related Pol polyprotein from transposon RE2 [Sesamum angolense]|uniref:Retrovirus-related Pol polyprotein from transposon RE2 n=1 Tax=Sesamum angolense TaxID=2727404 RepID=A0AAE1XFK0_9LAMI|nr:Retrovirus-related Pol polyprotein from transposon RE2 [Sesamum angolense]
MEMARSCCRRNTKYLAALHCGTKLFFKHILRVKGLSSNRKMMSRQANHVTILEFETAVKHKVWVQAMEEEIKMIEKNNTWELADRPKDKEVIGVKWIYKMKLNADGSIQKHKARLVAKGYSQLPGFIAKGSEEKVLRLKKALYGLKQAPSAWYSRIDKYFMDRGFRRSLSEPTLYIKSQGSTRRLLLKKFKNGKAAKTVTTPLVTGEKYQKEDGSQKVDGSMYKSLIGSLLYLTATRPDIMFATSLLSRFMQSPSQVRYGAAKRILRYLRGSVDDMKSTSGYTFFTWVRNIHGLFQETSYVAILSGSRNIAAAATSNQAIGLEGS